MLIRQAQVESPERVPGAKLKVVEVVSLGFRPASSKTWFAWRVSLSESVAMKEPGFSNPAAPRPSSALADRALGQRLLAETAEDRRAEVAIMPFMVRYGKVSKLEE